jgi:hypothetical protein
LKPWTDEWERLPPDIQEEILAYDQIASYGESKDKVDLLTQLVKALTPKAKK